MDSTQNSNPSFLKFLNTLHYTKSSTAIQTCRRFIQKKQIRILNQLNPNVNPFLLTPGNPSDSLIPNSSISNLLQPQQPNQLTNDQLSVLHPNFIFNPSILPKRVVIIKGLFDSHSSIHDIVLCHIAN
jgi:hypothetical protein